MDLKSGEWEKSLAGRRKPVITREEISVIEVYYAEDDEMIAKSVMEYLEQQNCKVTILTTVADVKRACRSHIPTIILIDWNLPDGQGSDLCC